MVLVALTGGIGSGKSTVASGFEARGAAVVEADAIGRQILEPGGPAHQPVIDRFGPGVVRPDGTIDRAAVASIVFRDPASLADLNRISHPAIARVMADRVAALAEEGRPIVVIDIALMQIATPDLFDFDAVVVVDVPEDVAVARLVAGRGFSEADARARVAAQTTRADRTARADLVIDNSDGRGALQAEIERAWVWLSDRYHRQDA